MAEPEPRIRSTWLDRTVGYVSPRWQLGRLRSRMMLDVLASHYDAAQTSRRTQGWKRPGGDPNAPAGVTAGRLRDSSRHLVRNNGHAQAALQVITDDTVGWGIMPSEKHDPFRAWSESTDIDADGRCDLAGLEMMVMRTVVQDGECLVRRRWRRLSDGLALPMQLQVLEPDFLDFTKHQSLPNGGRIIRGVEFDALGKRAGYWLFKTHPGSTILTGSTFQKSVRVPASEVAHIFRHERPGQVRGASWFAPVLLRFNDFDELADATLMKQKVSALLAVVMSDLTGAAPRIGAEDTDNELHDLLEPGMILNLPPDQSVEVVQPPSVREYADYSKTILREIAAGIGLTYEDLTGDYTRLPFSAARMSRLRHWARVEGWRWRMLVPQLLNPIWKWGMQGAAVAGLETTASTFWSAPPLPMIEPDKEGLAILRNIRTGITTLPEELRRRGLNVAEQYAEMNADQKERDRLGIVVDSDVRQMTQAGQRHKDMAVDSDAVAALTGSSEDFMAAIDRIAGKGNGASA